MFRGSHLRLLLRLAALAFLTVAISSTESWAGSLKHFHAKLFAYFEEYNVLPVFPPRGEVPGEVYVTPAGEFLYRWDDCFGDLKAYEQDTVLASVFELNSDDLRASGRLAARQVANLETQHNIYLSDVVEISFYDAVIRGFTRTQILDTLRALPNVACHAEILKILRGDPGQNLVEGVPWIISEVWHAKEKASLASQQQIDSQLQVELKDQIKRMDAEVDLQFKHSAQGMITVVSKDKAFPVAWRPAFISSDHLKRINELKEQDLFSRFLAWANLKDSPIEVLLLLRKDFPDDLVRPTGIAEKMSMGTPIPFNRENEEHLEYLGMVDLLFAMSWEIYREP